MLNGLKLVFNTNHASLFSIWAFIFSPVS